MKAPKVRCEGCKREFWAPRRDTKWCSNKCRSKIRSEDARFLFPKIPKSGVKGISFNRTNKVWTVKDNNKYLGSFKDLNKAIKFHKEYHET